MNFINTYLVFIFSDEDMSDGSSIAPIRGHKPNIEELELLLGAYFMQMEEILNKLLNVSRTLTCYNFWLDPKLLLPCQ